MLDNSSVKMPVQSLTAVKALASESVGDAQGGSAIDLEFDQMDNKIIAATLKAFESGSLTPLIKEELRCTIQSRRLAEGKGEMKVEFKAPLRKKEMTDEERGRALKRRTQNREAAQRFRQKQKDTSDYLSAKIRKLEYSSKSLSNDLQRLKGEKELLKQMLESHLLVCTNPAIQNNTHCQHPNSHHIISDTPSTPSSSQFSPRSSGTDFQSISTITDCVPDTAASDSSVFFGDDDSSEYISLQPVVQVPTFGFEEEDLKETLMYDEGQYLEVGCEETVVNIDDTDSEFDEERRPESCSSSDTLMFNAASCSADWNKCLSQSMQGVTSAYVRAHVNSCSSEAFDVMTDDLFHIEDMTP